MEGKNLGKTFHLINTKGHCFLCLKWIISEGNYTQSIRNVCRYLNIKINDLISASDSKGKLDIDINLCAECNKMVSKISELFQFHEVIKMELDYWVESVSKTISGSEEDIPGKKNFLEDMKGEGSNLRVTNKLRMILLDKYFLRSEKKKPTVLIERVKNPVSQVKGQNEGITTLKTPLGLSNVDASRPILYTADINQIKDNLIFLPESKSFQCRKCEKTFSRKETFKMHFESFHLKIQYECKFCGEWVSHKMTYYRHRKRCLIKYNKYTNDKRNDLKFDWGKCAVAKRLNLGKGTTAAVKKAKRALLSAADYKRVKENTVDLPDKRVQCKQCLQSFATRYSFEAHFKSIHLKIKEKCEFCGKRVKKSQFYQHRRKCRSKGRERPSLSTESSTSKKENVNINQIKENMIFLPESKHFKCKQCRNVFTRKHSFERHFESVHLKIKYECEYCKKQIKGRAFYYRHRKKCMIKLGHQDKAEVVIDKSNLIFLTEREKSQTPVEGRASLSTADINLMKENQVLLPDYNFVKCKQCLQVFSCKATFKLHFEAKHLKIKYNCELCGKISLHKTEFYRHRKKCRTMWSL